MTLQVSSSPYIRDIQTTGRIMREVLLALLPSLLIGIWRFGARAALVVLVSVFSAIASEWLFRRMTRQHPTVSDGSAAVTGLLLALSLPVSVPYHIPVIGSVFAVVVIKGLGGGLGRNAFNPALAARAFLMLLYPTWLVRYPTANLSLPIGTLRYADITTSATPLHHMRKPAMPEISLFDALVGNMSGCIGEISAVAILAGGVYLLFRKILSVRIPLAYLSTAALLTFLFPREEPALRWMLYQLLSGGLLLGAIFMATDYASAPVLPKAQWIYGIGCGMLTVLLRYRGLYPEGVTYAILLMNALSHLADRHGGPARFGSKRRTVREM